VIQISRYDKYDPVDGGFRAALAAAWTATSGPAGVTDLNRILVVGLDANGKVIKATTALLARGIVIVTRAMAAGDVVDVMTDGEVVELAAADLQAATAPIAGTQYIFEATAARLAAEAGAPTAGTNFYRVGHTVESTRLVVRTRLMQG
jgi:hypothetical protein